MTTNRDGGERFEICYLAYVDSVQPNYFFDHFSGRGHLVHIFGTGSRDPGKDIFYHDISPMKGKRRTGKKGTPPPKMRSPMVKRTIRKKAMNQALNVWNIMTTRKMIKRIGPDIVHGYDAMGWGLHTALSGRGARIMTCNGSDIFRYPWESGLTYRKIRFSLNRADLIHLTFPYSREFVMEKFGVDREKIRVIPFGIDLELFDPRRPTREDLSAARQRFGIGEDDTVMLFPKGFRNDDRQNYVNILKAFIRLRKERGDLKLLMLSYNFDHRYEDVRSLIAKNDLENDVKVIEEMLPQRSMPLLYSISDIHLVLPDTDQFSSSILEGMMMGSIPLLSDLRTYRYVLQEEKNCFFTDRKDPESIERSLAALLDMGKGKKDMMVDKNRSLIREMYDRKKQMPEIERMYIDLVKSKKR